MPRLLAWPAFAGLCVLGLSGPGRAEAPERAWAFTPPRRPSPPAVRDAAWPANPIDAFVLARLEAAKLAPAPPADRLTWLRRVTYDLTGLPPTVAEQDAFRADRSPDAYRRVADRLLASPHYGERWATFWLDLVRYAETNGFKADEERPAAHRYRDYVIRASNADLPYDRFVRQQLAGDELEPGNPQALVATGLNRLWPDEYNAANLEQRRQEILDDVTEVTGLAFLGLTVGCARCHDHKFDPILQTDYYRLQAFFAPMQPHDDQYAAGPDRLRRYRTALSAWEQATRPLRAEMDALLAAKRAELREYALQKFRPEIQQAVRTLPAERTPYQAQIAAMAEKQMRRAELDAPAKLPPAARQRYRQLEQRLAKAGSRPEPPPVAMAITDVGRQAPPTHRLAGGDWRHPRKELRPGFPEFLPPAPVDTHLDGRLASTGRRAALARWLTRPDHPLTARVIANRLWQQHFGRGIVGTPNDFGTQGERPTHPELLDWLAVELTEHGWSLKHLHRLMVLSSTYRQASAKGDNRLFAGMPRRRLEGEAVRDAWLSLAGRLNPRMYGPSARPGLPAGLSSYAWKPDARAADQDRRSVYVFVKRNLRYPLFDAFDLPDLHNSCPRRSQTVTAPQALVLLNGELALDCARAWAEALRERYGEDRRGLVAAAVRAAWGRPATAADVRLGLDFLDRQASGLLSSGTGPAERAALADFCQALLIANEFLYVD